MLEQKKAKEELTWQGRTPLRQAFHRGRYLPETKPLDEKVLASC